MQCVQGRSRRRWHPCCVRASLRMRDLLFEHGRHHIRHGPHALADLRTAGQATGETDVDVPGLVGLDPRRRPHLRFADHRTGVHRGVDLVAGAVEESRVDEEHAALGGADAGLEIDRGASLLVHDAHLDGVGRQAQDCLDARECVRCESDLVGAVHLRLDDVDRSHTRVGALTTIMQRNGRGHQRIDETLGRFAAVGQQYGVRRHEVADVADQHQ